MKISILLVLALCIFQSHTVRGSDVDKYVFYLHGAIVEGTDPKPTHPQYGLYDYSAIIDSLSMNEFILISEQREKDTKISEYAHEIVTRINGLIEIGVQAENITVVGFSKGAMITTIISSVLKNEDVNYVIMAICGDWYETDEFLKELRLSGHVLSIYEESDSAGSCQKLANRSPAPVTFSEKSINTGKEHGAFYLPDNRWINPIVSWIYRNDS